MARNDMSSLMENNRTKILKALYRYYTKNVTLQRAAQDEGVPLRLVIQARNDYHLPIVFSDKDLESGRERIKVLVRDERVRVP